MSSKFAKSASNQTTRSNTISEPNNALTAKAHPSPSTQPKSKAFNYYYLFDECNMLKLKPISKQSVAHN